MNDYDYVGRIFLNWQLDATQSLCLVFYCALPITAAQLLIYTGYIIVSLSCAGKLGCTAIVYIYSKEGIVVHETM